MAQDGHELHVFHSSADNSAVVSGQGWLDHSTCGMLQSAIAPDPAEVADVEFMSVRDIGRSIKRDPNFYAYWFKHYFDNHAGEIARLARAASR